jgi:phosphate starvation-inducible PhoH-like protein
MNSRQNAAMSMLRAGKLITILAGSAGTGKSIIAVERAASLIREKKIKKVYLVRPPEGMGKTIGLLPGDLKEKLTPFFAQTLRHFEKFLGKGYTAACLADGKIEMMAAEHIRGVSFEDCFVIIEEAQNFPEEHFETVLTRLGENCQIVFTGDERQNDLKGKSGLRATVAKIQHTVQTEPAYLTDADLDELEQGIGVVQFLPEDVVRHGLTRALVKMYYYQS